MYFPKHQNFDTGNFSLTLSIVNNIVTTFDIRIIRNDLF